MKTYLLSIVAAFPLLLAGSFANDAQAQGIHFGGGGVHVDVGSPHSYYGNYGGYYSGYGGGGWGYGGYGSYPSTAYYGGGWGGYGGWHDTTHLDYHPSEFVHHRRDHHYAPGHYDAHEDGHWD